MADLALLNKSDDQATAQGSEAKKTKTKKKAKEKKRKQNRFALPPASVSFFLFPAKRPFFPFSARLSTKPADLPSFDLPYAVSRMPLAIFLLFFISSCLVPASYPLQAGSVSHLDLFTVHAPQYWAAFYGNVSSSVKNNFESVISEPYNQNDPLAVPPRVHALTARYGPSCVTTEDWLFISNTTTDFAWSALVEASLSDLNAFNGVSRGSVEDADRFFYANGSFSLPGVRYSNTSYISFPLQDGRTIREYVLKDPRSGVLVFAIPLVFPSTAGFKNATVNYEALLPRGPRYYFLAHPGFCVLPKYQPSSPQLVSEPLGTLAKAVPPSLPSKPETAPIPPSESSEPAPQTFTVVQSSQSVVTATISESQTIISSIYTFPENGIQTLQVQFPFPSTYLTENLAEVQLIKMDPSVHSINAIADSLSRLDFADLPDYRLIAKGNQTLFVWVLSANAGDVYAARASIQKSLSNATIALTHSQASTGDLSSQLFPTPRPASRLDVQVQPLATTGVSLALAVLIAGVSLLGVWLWRHPWVWHYLSSGKHGYLYHFFISSRRKAFHK